MISIDRGEGGHREGIASAFGNRAQCHISRNFSRNTLRSGVPRRGNLSSFFAPTLATPELLCGPLMLGAGQPRRLSYLLQPIAKELR